MKKIIPLLLVACYFISAFYEWVFVWWFDLIELPESMYAGYDFAGLLVVAIAWGTFWFKVPLEDLALKAILFWLFLDAVWNAGQFFASGEYQGPLSMVNLIIWIPWLCRSWRIRCKARGVVPVDGKVYKVTHSPDSYRGFYVALIAELFGGYGALVNGKHYSFKNSVFSVFDGAPEGALFIESGIEATAKVESRLKAKLGEKWSRNNNCVTLWKGDMNE